MGALDDLLAKGYAAASGGDRPAPAPASAPALDPDVAALLGRSPANPTTPPAPEGAAADVAALSGKSPGPVAPQPAKMPSVSDVAKFGVNLAGTAAEKIGDLTSTEGLRRSAATGEWEVDPDYQSKPWYRRAADAAGDVLAEGVIPWAKRKGGELVEALPAAISGVGHGVTAGLAPNIVAQAQNEAHELLPDTILGLPTHRPEKTSAREVQLEHEARAKEHPAGDLIGDALGSGVLAAATGPGAGTRAIAGQLGGRGAQTAARVGGGALNSAAQYIARSVTDKPADEPWKKRIYGGVKEAVDSPATLAAAAALPAAAEGVSAGLSKIAKGTGNAAKDAYSHLFLPAHERALLEAAEGPGAVRKLVGEVQDEGILGGLVPTARSVSRRAGQVVNRTGAQISDKLDEMLAASKSAGGRVDTTALVKELQDAADNLILNSGRNAADKEVKALEDTIQRIRARGIQGQQGQMDLERAVKMLKDFQANTKYDPTVATREPIEQAINMTGWKGLKDATTNSFRGLEQSGHLPAGSVDQYKDLQKSFHTAKTVHYPALKVAEKVAQARGQDPSNLLGAALLGGQFGAPAAFGVTLGGVPHGVSGRVLEGLSGVAKGGTALSELSNRLRVPQSLGKPLAAEAKESNEQARSEIRERREKLARRARAKNELEKSLGVKLR